MELQVNNNTRRVTIPANYILGVAHDGNTSTITFTMDKPFPLYDSTYSIYINYKNAKGGENSYRVEKDSIVFDEEENTLSFDWVVGFDAVAVGQTYFKRLLI